LYGYARVSTDDQNLDLQHEALSAVGCEQIFDDRITGTARKASWAQRAMRACATGDVLVVWRLDRLGRSLGHLIEMLTRLRYAGIQFRSLMETIDTTTTDRS